MPIRNYVELLVITTGQQSVGNFNIADGVEYWAFALQTLMRADALTLTVATLNPYSRTIATQTTLNVKREVDHQVTMLPIVLKF